MTLCASSVRLMASRQKMFARCFNWFNHLLDVFAAAAAALLMAILLAVCTDVFSRALLDAPLPWVLEFSEAAMMAAVLLGMGWLTKERGHVAIEFIVNRIPGKKRVYYESLASILVAVCLLNLAAWSISAAQDDFQRGVLTTGLYVYPRWIQYAGAAASLVLTAIVYTQQAVSPIIDKKN